MSDTTRDALEAAMQAHVNDESPGYLITGYVLGASITSFATDNTNDAHSYWFQSTDNQPTHVTRGLSSILEDWAVGSDIYQDDDDA